jgi:hypothetical protein
LGANNVFVKPSTTKSELNQAHRSFGQMSGKPTYQELAICAACVTSE